MTRTLVLMRHAKAEQVPGGPWEGDAARRLTRRGRADAAAAGRYLVDIGCVPDHALVSSATRTQETWEEVRHASGARATDDVTATLYGAAPETVLQAIQQVDPDVGVLIVVGHNPEMESLAYRISDGEGDEDVRLSLRAGFPTATLAVYDVAVEWADVTEGSLAPRRVHVARA